MRARYKISEAKLLDRRGDVIEELRSDMTGRRLDWAPLSDVSPALVIAVLSAEDRRFYSHHGVDWRSLAAAVVSTARGRRRGASTVTMQLASRLDRGLQPRVRGRTILQKWRQLRYAIALERSWSKQDILEAYLNLNLARGELTGARSLARGLFDKEPSGLDAAEASVLAALLREPAASAARVLRRARRLDPTADPAALELTARRAIGRPPAITAAADLAPEAARRLLFGLGPSEGPRATVARSTIDGRVQSFARRALAARLREIDGENVSDAAVLVADNATGEVLAYVGNGGAASSSARFVDGIASRRQAGSALKPFLYALAFDRRVLTPASLLDDSPLELQVGRGLFRPNNYDNLFRGPVTARQALASSINIPAVRTLGLVGGQAFVDELARLGFSDLQAADFYGPSLALGTADVTLWEIVGAYRALADGGRYAPLALRLGEKAGGAKRAFSSQAAFLVGDILSDRESRSSTFGLDGPLATPYWTAVKTGTSKDMRDNWCVGFSRRYTVGVWVGNFSGKPMWNVSGVSGAAPLWRDVMDYLYEGARGGAPRPPAGVVRSGREWFMAGTEPRGATTLAEPTARILEPVSGAILALDPDIPANDQRVLFEASGGSRWRLDGVDLGPVVDESGFAPSAGRHRLELTDASGAAFDSVEFEVRGARLAETELAEPQEDAGSPSEL